MRADAQWVVLESRTQFLYSLSKGGEKGVGREAGMRETFSLPRTNLTLPNLILPKLLLLLIAKRQAAQPTGGNGASLWWWPPPPLGMSVGRRERESDSAHYGKL